MAALKKGSKAAKDFMAKIRAAKGKTKPKKVGATKILVAKKQSGEANRKYDKLVQALPAGKRKTAKTHYANGKKITHSTIYTETRKNHSDKGKLLGIGIQKTINGMQKTYIALYESKDNIVEDAIFEATSLFEAKRYANQYKRHSPEFKKYKSIRTSVRLYKN